MPPPRARGAAFDALEKERTTFPPQPVFIFVFVLLL